MATIAAVAEAFPDHYYDQQKILAELTHLWSGNGLDRKKLERIHRNTGVEGRHLALPLHAYRDRNGWGEDNRTWLRIGEEIGARVVVDALDQAGLGVADVEALLFVSVTGVATPSIDARLVNRIGLPTSVKRLPIFGLGCVAGAAGLARCADLAPAHPNGAIVLLSVELCSLTFQQGDLSGANMVATGIFGDGAAAVVVVGNKRPAAGPAIVASRSILYPGTEHMMGWEISEQGFKLILSREIPRLIREHLPADVDAFLGEQGLERSDIHAWIAHTGGPGILNTIQESLQLPASALACSWDRLKKVGNVSSASVLQVLKRTMDHATPPPGAYGLLLALGPGFCCELVLVRWHGQKPPSLV